MTPLNQGWGEGGVGSEEVKCVCRLVTLRFQDLFAEVVVAEEVCLI